MLLAAQAGDVDAQYAIANKYWEGIGTTQNRILGYAWAMVAAHYKNEMAMATMNMGLMERYITPE